MRVLAPGDVGQTRTINMNKFGDDFVSFTPMHISFSPDGQFFLLSTGTE